MASLKDLTKAKKLSQIEKALLKAQQNAALPIAQGGLGLSALNTPEERAAAMGAIDYLHGTQRLERLLQGKSLDPRRATSGPMPFGTESPELASTYAMSKSDTSRIATDEGNMADYFQVSPKALGQRGSTPYSVEQSYYQLSPEKKAELLKNYYRVGYADPDQVMGKIVLHPEGKDGSIASKDHLDYILKREAKGNPLTAMRILWGESGELFDEPEKLADVYKAAGYPHEISQANAPWFEAKGVMTGKALVQNPLRTQNSEEILSKVVPALEQAFKGDRTRKLTVGVDPWDKRARFTPKEWVEQLKTDLSSGENSYVWTSIPDKVTAELKKLGYDSILDISGKGGGAEKQVVIPFEPSQIRSRFAAFDPMRKGEANLLASHPLASAGAALAATGGLSGMAKDYLSQPHDPGNLYAQYGLQPPMTRGEALKGAISAVPGIGEALSGVEGLQAASEGKWGEAGLGALGALPMVAGTFIGPKAASKTFQQQLDAAKLLQAKGATPKDIWHEKMMLYQPWERSPELQWASEVSDVGTDLSGMAKKTFTPNQIQPLKSYKASFDKFMPHGEVESLYPWMNKMEVRSDPMLEGGSYQQIESPFAEGGIARIMRISQSGEEPRLSGLHEKQHAISDFEGWSPGGSASNFPTGDTLNDAQLIAQLLQRGVKEDAINAYFQKVFGRNPSTKSAVLGKTYGKELHTWPSNPDTGYYRLTDEARARAVESRAGMGLEQLRENYPLQNDVFGGVPLHQLITLHKPK